MTKHILIIVSIVLLLIAAGCEKVADPSEVVADGMDSIPAEFGTLVAVTTMAEYPGWSQMWFQGDDGTIRMVRYHFIRNVIMTDVKTLNRM